MSGRSLAIIAAIIAIAVSLSLVSYQYSQYSALAISEISKQNARTTTEIQGYDLANSLSNKLKDVTSLLQVISGSRSVNEGRVMMASTIFNGAQDATSDIADFYMWLDQDGKIVWISNLNQTAYEKYKGLDLSYRLYFTESKRTHQAYYSGVVDSNDRIDRLYISYPILGFRDMTMSVPPSDTPLTGDFKGVVVAGLRTEHLGKFLESQISPSLKSEVGLTDNSGIILYSQDNQFVGKNVFGIKYQSFLQSTGSDSARLISTGFEQGLRGNAGVGDIVLQGKRAVFVYAPIAINEKQFGVLYIIAPFAEASEVDTFVESQKNLSFMIIIAIGIAAISAVLVILRWNRSLEKTVSERTTQLLQANEKLTINDKLQREFINVAAHELRTPVQPILGMSELLESEMGDRREDVRLIARNARRLERLTQDILDVSKIESGSLTLRKERIDLAEIITSVIIEYRDNPQKATDASMSNGEMKVQIRYEPKSVFVMADRDRIQQVLSNLINNALKFTTEGSVSVKTEVIDKFVRVTVRDSGLGIDPEILPRLFQKFATKSEKGTGLGLYISKNIVEAHGGKIWAENNSGAGATFYFELPLLEISPETLGQ